jgi:hypothetical protein
LVRGGGRSALILSDVDGVRGALSEQGARRAGKEYDIEPIAVSTGVFHPKITALVGQEECHLIVGSGNLTFGGWGGNFEIFEHLHSGFAADAIRDAAEFFTLLADAPRVRHGARLRCLETAADLRQSVDGTPGDGKIRLIHNLERSILAQISELVAELGGAERLVVASPYWDGGTALDSVCAAIKVDRAYVHSHPSGIVRGSFGSNWPRNSKASVVPVCLDALSVEDDKRLLHAKVFEVVCSQGRLIVSGSANATRAALGEGNNVESCIVRIERGRATGWIFAPAEPPDELDALDADADDEEKCGVLRAILEGDTLYGQVLHPGWNGAAAAFLMTSDGARPLGSIQLDNRSQFSVHVSGLEVEILQGHRFILAIETKSARAEGFISVTAFSEISRRSGALASRLIALLAGNETPADVAAIMSWICEDPNVLNRDLFVSRGSPANRGLIDAERTIAVDDLRASLDEGASGQPPGKKDPDASWKRFIEAFLASLRQRRGPFQGQPGNPIRDDEENEEESEREPKDPGVERSMGIFPRVFNALLTEDNAQRFFTVAFDLAQYVCRRLEPQKSEIVEWLRILIHVRNKYALQLERPENVAAVILVLYSNDLSMDGVRGARLQLLRMNRVPEGACPDMSAVDGFRSALAPEVDFDEQWERIKNVRTMPEQVRAFLKAVETNIPTSEYPDLRSSRDEWSTLANVFNDPDSRDDFKAVPKGTTACPRCSRDLPKEQIGNLQTRSVAIAKNCCGLVLVCAEV